ncbi:MAG: RDD family protein [SAR324 cluster bacterium]|nr:RDD family protein [SAR324 cluster bacterium]
MTKKADDNKTIEMPSDLEDSEQQENAEKQKSQEADDTGVGLINEQGVQIVAAPSIKRIGAFSIDYLVITLMLSALSALFLPERWDMLPTEAVIYSLAPVYLVGLILFFFKDHFGGRSIGKAFMNLYVSQMAETFPVATSNQLLKRNLWLLILPVEAIKMIFDPYCRRFGDRHAKTVVMEIKRPAEVRRLTTKAIGGMLVISVLWSAYVNLTPLKVEKSAGYQVAKEALLEDAKIRATFGDMIQVGGHLEVNYEQGKEIYIFQINEDSDLRRIQVVLERKEEQFYNLGVFLLREKKAEENPESD